MMPSILRIVGALPVCVLSVGALSIGALPSSAQAEINWRVAARGGASFKEDGGFDLVTAEPVAPETEFMLERRIIGPYWIGLTAAGSSMQGTAFETLDARWQRTSFKLTAMARWRLLQYFAFYGRLGPTLNRTALAVTRDSSDEALESVSWDIGVHAGAGFEWMPIVELTPEGEIDMAFGFSLEASYQRIVPADIELGDATIGSLDPSGPGIALGLSLEW